MFLEYDADMAAIQRHTPRRQAGRVIAIDDDLATRRAILRARAESRGVNVPETVIAYIAENLRASIRELEGALHSVIAQAVLTGKRLDLNLAKTGGNPQEQDMTGFAGQWSNDAHLWWTEAKPGDRLDLALPVSQAGRQQLKLQLTKAPDYAIIQLYLDGSKLGGPLDLYHPEVVPTGALDFGTHDLSAGERKLSLEILGANPKAIKNYMAGLDYVVLELER